MPTVTQQINTALIKSNGPDTTTAKQFAERTKPFHFLHFFHLKVIRNVL